jgi:transposase-like protein
MHSIPTLDEFNILFPNELSCLQYLHNHNVFYSSIICSGCFQDIRLTPDRSSFMCNRRVCLKRGHRISYQYGTFFYESSLSCIQVLKIGLLWLAKASVETSICLTGHSSTTICNFYRHFRQLVSSSLTIEDQIIGGEGIEVAIDETKLGKRKYNRGHYVDGVWVLVGIELIPNGKIFLVPIENRSENTLSNLIVQYVRPRSIINTDMWRGYNGISSLGYIHLTVNHSLEFVNHATGACTNAAEGLNSGLKRRIPIRNRTRNLIDGHLMEYIWRRRYKSNLFEALINSIRDIHCGFE